jgi:hypothetical protein
MARGRRVVDTYAVEYDSRKPGAVPKPCPRREEGWRVYSNRCISLQLEWQRVTGKPGLYGPYWFAYLRKRSRQYLEPGTLISVYVGKPEKPGGRPSRDQLLAMVGKLEARGALD